MKEITRIHIAKIAYEIEINAKKALERYLNSLEVYANDTELLNDIEIRITELLAERGIMKDGVIAMADIEAIEKQLGEPHDFMDGDDVPAGANESLGDEPVRKLYRNTDNAVLGGVLSGAASYFKIDPLWLRIAAVVLFFASSGVALLVYVVMWFLVPPARTAAEKLRMIGQPVTLASLRGAGDDLAAREVLHQRAQLLRRLVAKCTGVLFTLGALTALGVTIVVIFRTLYMGGYYTLHEPYNLVSFILAISAGLLLALLFTLAAYSSFIQTITKRLLVIGGVIIVAGLSSFGAAVGIIWYHQNQIQQATVSATKTTMTTFPSDFGLVKTLKINAQGVRVTYVVSNDAPYMSLTALSYLHTQYALSGAGASISVTGDDSANSNYGYVMPTLTIFGPALEHVDLVDGTLSYVPSNQKSLSIQVMSNTTGLSPDAAVASIDGGSIEAVSFVSENNGWLTLAADNASIRSVDAKLHTGDTLRLGKIENLTVTYPDVCAGGTNGANIKVAAIQSQTMTINQKALPTQSMHEACGGVQIGASNNP